MLRVPVISSNVRSVGYDRAAALLEVEFHSGGIYHYHSVPAYVFQGLMNAASKGGYLAHYVKGVYSYRRVR